MRAVAAFAPAKVNLTLRVGAARGDGLHVLASVVAFGDVGDVVTLEEGPPALTIEGPFAAGLSAGPENLVRRALDLLGVSARARLEKNLPVASGLGGGSADAAASLRAGRLFAGLDIDGGALARRSSALGADVPACVLSTSLYMTGAGEQVTAFPLPVLHAVLANPGQPCPTAAVYRRFDEMGLGAGFSAAPPAAPRDMEAALELLAAGGNDLELPAIRTCPVIADVLALLRADPRVRVARLSGSGATCFALVQTRESAVTLARDVLKAAPDWWVRPARLGPIDAAARAL